MRTTVCHHTGMISPVLLIVAALAAARITRLITRDTLTQPIRLRAINAVGPTSQLAYLITCDWCTGMWVGAAVGVPVWLWPHQPWLICPLIVLALAETIGLIASRDGA